MNFDNLCFIIFARQNRRIFVIFLLVSLVLCKSDIFIKVFQELGCCESSLDFSLFLPLFLDYYM